jgi:thymidylate synthase (FAD)
MVTNSKIKAILNKPVKVLDKGFVELCDVMGDDETIVRCARQSYDKADLALSQETIERQINYMMKNHHTSPFEQVVFRFRIRAPIFVIRQWIRHRTARVNELSGRYTEFSEDDFHVPDGASFYDRIPESQKPLSQEAYEEKVVKPATALIESVKESNAATFESYKQLLGQNIPKELARVGLPLTLYTELYWQMDLHNLMHFLELRLDSHAQREIREYAYTVFNFMKMVCPITAKAFETNRLNTIPVNISILHSIMNYFDVGNSRLMEHLDDEEKKEISVLKLKVDEKLDFLTMLNRSMPEDVFGIFAPHDENK